MHLPVDVKVTLSTTSGAGGRCPGIVCSTVFLLHQGTAAVNPSP